MSKILVALMVLTVAVAAQGCSDTCQGKQPGSLHPSYCGPCNQYYVCSGVKIIYKYCSGNNQCLIKGVCGRCQDQCYGKPDGNYPSSDNPRPFYYRCYNGVLSYTTCHPNEVFNAWTRKCECYEVFCETHNGLQPSMCGYGCSGYVMCKYGYAQTQVYVNSLAHDRRSPRQEGERYIKREIHFQIRQLTTTLTSDDVVPSLDAALSVFSDINHNIEPSVIPDLLYHLFSGHPLFRCHLRLAVVSSRFQSAIMSKLIAALAVLCVVYAVQGCKLDTCHGKSNGVSYPSYCGPCHYYYVCIHMVITYRWCSLRNQCVINGHCGPCGDSCVGKPDGRYPSINRARPYYYTCEAGQLFYRECQPFQIFNAWSKKCECFEGSCLHGNGWRGSFCRGKRWRVFCLGGFAKYYRRCPIPQPHVSCVTYQCVVRCNVYVSHNRCCRN
ncbi:hypothetical protein LSAT2_001446 [Lamellibrachia satsuma]|nr:hypothetical protein LSAT2_001446 [Lamellibrachia satsuma]